MPHPAAVAAGLLLAVTAAVAAAPAGAQQATPPERATAEQPIARWAGPAIPATTAGPAHRAMADAAAAPDEQPAPRGDFGATFPVASVGSVVGFFVGGYGAALVGAGSSDDWEDAAAAAILGALAGSVIGAGLAAHHLGSPTPGNDATPALAGALLGILPGAAGAFLLGGATSSFGLAAVGYALGQALLTAFLATR